MRNFFYILIFIFIFSITNVVHADKWPRFQLVSPSGDLIIGTTNKIFIAGNKITFYNQLSNQNETIDYFGIFINTYEGELSLDNNKPIFTINFFDMKNHPANGKKFNIGTKTQNGWIISKEDIDKLSKKLGIYKLIKNNL